jgi:hypothetical protein
MRTLTWFKPLPGTEYGTYSTAVKKYIKAKTNLENENICDASEGDSQVDDLRLRHLVGDVPDVNHLQERKIS